MHDQKMVLPRKTIICMSSGMLILILIAITFLVPLSRKITRLDSQLMHSRNKLAAMKELYPEYTRLLGVEHSQSSFKLIPYDEKRLQEQDISIFGNTLATICTQTGMDFVSATPSPESITGENHRVLVDVVIRGDFLLFRNFLLNLLQVPSLEHLQQIQVRPIPENREYRLQIWVALQ